MELEQSRTALRAKGLALAAISYDSTQLLAEFASRKKIGFPLLSDPDSAVIRAFGIFNEKVPKGNLAFGTPHPVTFVIGQNGAVVSKHADDDYRQRFTASNLLIRNFGLRTGAARTQSQTGHLTVESSASDAVVRAGERIRLVLDIDLKPRMHVYAPDVKGYIPIQWKMKDAEWAALQTVEFPQSRVLHLPAIDEKVPVFEKKFALQREVIVAPAARLKTALGTGTELVLEGELEYQACDDTKCYVPQTIPLKWVFRYEPPDSQRSPPELRRQQ